MFCDNFIVCAGELSVCVCVYVCVHACVRVSVLMSARPEKERRKDLGLLSVFRFADYLSILYERRGGVSCPSKINMDTQKKSRTAAAP